MQDRHRLEAGAKQIQRPAEQIEFHLREAAVFVIAREDIAEHLLDAFHRRWLRIERNFSVLVKGKRTEIVKPKDVVGVGMGVEDGIDAANTLADGLFAEVRARVNQDMTIAELDEDRGPCAPVMRVRRSADFAGAAD